MRREGTGREGKMFANVNKLEMATERGPRKTDGGKKKLNIVNNVGVGVEEGKMEEKNRDVERGVLTPI